MHLETALRRRVRVHGDRRSGRPVRPRHRPHDPLDVGRHARLVDRALEERGAYAVGPRDADGEVADEHVDHRVGQVRQQPRPAVPEVERRRVVGVDAGRDDDREVDLLRDPHDARDVAAETDDRRVDDGVVAGRRELGQLRDRVPDRRLLVPLVMVCLYIGGQDEDVLVHQGAAERGRVDEAGGRGYVGHVRDPMQRADRLGT